MVFFYAASRRAARVFCPPILIAALVTASPGCEDGPSSGPIPAGQTGQGPGAATPPPSAVTNAQGSTDASAGDAAAEASVEAPAAPLSGSALPSAAGTDAGAGDAGAKSQTAGTKDTKDTKTGAADAGTGDAGSTGPTGAGAQTAAPSIPPPEPGSADAIAAQIDAIFVGKKVFTARFKQEHTQKVSGAVKKSSGTLFVEKPSKLSFRYDPPNKNRIVSDGTSLKVYVAEDEQMFVQPVAKTEYPGALSFLMGSGLRPSFTFSIHDKAKFEGGPVLLGKPRAPTPHYEYVMFYVDKALLEKKDPGVIRRVLIVDAQGNKNRFDFENASQPASADPKEFVFDPPAGTAIKNSAGP